MQKLRALYTVTSEEGDTVLVGRVESCSVDVFCLDSIDRGMDYGLISDLERSLSSLSTMESEDFFIST